MSKIRTFPQETAHRKRVCGKGDVVLAHYTKLFLQAPRAGTDERPVRGGLKEEEEEAERVATTAPRNAHPHAQRGRDGRARRDSGGYGAGWS